MKYFIGSLCTISGLVLSAFTSQAHPYASGVTITNGNVSYRVNESVTNGMVYVLFDNGSVSNFLGTTLAAGPQSFSLGGHSNFTINIFNVGTGAPHQISPNPGTNAPASPLVDFNGPRGVGVNHNPASPYFGTIYVANAAAGTDSVRSVTEGIYALNADFSDAFGYSSNAMPPIGTNAGQIEYGSSTTYGCYRVFVGPDDIVYIGDASGATGALTTVGGGVWMAQPNLSSAVDLFPFNGTDSGAGLVCSVGTPYAYGSYSNGTLTLYTLEWNRVPYQNVWEYQFFTTNASGTNTPLPLPWDLANSPIDFPNSGDCAPVYPSPYPLNANGYVNAGIATVDEVLCDMAIGPNGQFYLSEGRTSGQQESLRVFDNVTNGSCFLWGGYEAAGGGSANDPFQNSESVTVSPDGQYVATGTSTANTQFGSPAGYILYTPLTATNINGATNLPQIPPAAIIYDPASGGVNVRGVAFDLADNVYGVSGSDDSLRGFTLGRTSLAVTGNDTTGTNGTFNITFPGSQVSVTANANLISQANVYGNPTNVVFTLTRSGGSLALASPLTVNFTLSGTATNGVTYTTTATNSITFAPGETSTNITVSALQNSISAPTLSLTLSVVGNTSYATAPPSAATVVVANTGPQLLVITPAAANTMYRGITYDVAAFQITRYGDTNVPYTIPAGVFTYTGTAVSNVDFTQFAPSVAVNAGDQSETVYIGGPVPVFTTNAAGMIVPAVTGNQTIVVGFNSSAAALSGLTVATNTTTLTIIDNATGPEILLYSDLMTNAVDSTNWTLTFANSNLSTVTVPPILITNYPNFSPNGAGTTNDAPYDFDVEFGYGVANDGVGLSPWMAAAGWTNALKMTVNKNPAGISNSFVGSSAGVNVFPQGKKFAGNYALRFQMELTEGEQSSTEYNNVGINTQGTNCDWWAGDFNGGSGTTNSDGIWYTISSDPGGATFGDLVEFTGLGGKLPNTGWEEILSQSELTFANEFKHLELTGDPNTLTPYTGTATGSPANGYLSTVLNTWSDVEIKQFNGVITLSINKTPVFTYTNTTSFTNGDLMLGYDDPFSSIGNPAETGVPEGAVYYSNVRVVELGPAILSGPSSVVTNVGSPAGFAITAAGAAPFTNVFYYGSLTNGFAQSTNIVNSGDDIAALNFAAVNPTNAGNYFVVVSDASGSYTSSVVSLTVVSPITVVGPANITTNAGATATFTVTVTGSTPAFHWSFEGIGATNSTAIAGATNSTLTLTNVQAANEGTYTVSVTNLLYAVTNSATLTVTAVVASPPTFSGISVSGGNVVLTFTSTNSLDMTNSFTLQSSPVVTGPYTNSTAVVTTNSAGGFEVTVPESGATEFYRLEHK